MRILKNGYWSSITFQYVKLHTEMLLKQLNEFGEYEFGEYFHDYLDDDCVRKIKLGFIVTKPLVRTITI